MKKTKDTFLRELELQVLEALTKPMTFPQFELLKAKLDLARKINKN